MAGFILCAEQVDLQLLLAAQHGIAQARVGVYRQRKGQARAQIAQGLDADHGKSFLVGGETREDEGGGRRGNVTFFGEESNKEPVLWTEKLLVLNWEWPWPPAPRGRENSRVRIGASAIRPLEYFPFGLASPALASSYAVRCHGGVVGCENQAWLTAIVG